MAVEHRAARHGMAANVDGDGAVVGTNPALDAADGLRHDLCDGESFSSFGLALEEVPKHGTAASRNSGRAAGRILRRVAQFGSRGSRRQTLQFLFFTNTFFSNL